MGFEKDVEEIRRELSYAVVHHKDGHESKVVAVMLEVRELVKRTLNHLSKSEGENEEHS